MKKAKSHQQLFNEVKDYDLIIVYDQSLQEVLTRLYNRPLLGRLVYTPIQLTEINAATIFDRPMLNRAQTITHLSKEFSIKIKECVYFVDTIIDIWRKTGDIDSIIRHISIDRKEIISKLIDSIKSLPTAENTLQHFNHDWYATNKKIAVIGKEFLNTLELRCLPTKYTQISPFLDEEYSLSEINLFENEKEMLYGISNLITKKSASHYAIVSSEDNPYLTELQTTLQKQDIPIMIKADLKDNINVRIFIRFVEIGLTYDTITYREVRSLLMNFSVDIPIKYSNYRLSEIDFDFDRTIKELLSTIRSKKYKDILKFVSKSNKLPREFTQFLKDLSFRDKKITVESLLELNYALSNFKISNTTHKGVLFVDPKNASYLLKPIIIYIGLDESWDKQIIDEPWSDMNAIREQNRKRLSILLQQGRQQIYCTAKLRGNSRITISFTLQDILNKYFTSIEQSDLPKVYHKSRITNKFPSIVPDTNNASSIDSLPAFSNSSLNKFIECPKKYFYSKSISMEDNIYFKKGIILHAFAQFYSQKKDLYQKKGKEYFVNLLFNEYSKIHGTATKELDKTVLSIGVSNIIAFIDSQNIKPIKPLKSKSSNPHQQHDNIFEKHFGIKLNNDNTEVYFLQKDKLTGAIDLLVNDTLIVDYKTGKQKKRSEIYSSGRLFAKQKKKVDLQPLIYLSILTESHPNKELSFDYFFLLSKKHFQIFNKDYNVLEETIINVKYYPMSFAEFLTTNTAIKLLNTTDGRKKFIGKCGDENIKTYFKNNPFPKEYEFDKKGLEDSDYVQQFLNHFGKIKTNLISFFNYIVSIRTSSDSKNPIFFFKEDMEYFHSLLNDKIEEREKYHKTKYLGKPLSISSCLKCEFCDICLDYNGTGDKDDKQ